jgi:class 3 adenylate cyclase/tetratricopeptide (TPR) repeat protein
VIRTETATVVFTDLVGSTELTSRLGQDSYETIRRPHFASLRLAAADHNGIEIKSTGDGLVFAFASASDAVASMRKMQQATELAARLNNGEPRIRVGASSGETTRDGNDIFGIAVVEAARLCAAAGPGQILVSDLVKALNRGLEYKFLTVGQLQLKGLPEPIAACEVVWEPLASREGAVPLPPKIPSVPAFGLYGRAAEQTAIARCWEAVKRGERRVMLLGGEPGIGKTRLSTEAARIAHGGGAAVLFGSCDEDISHSYRPFVEALRHYVLSAPDDVLLHHVREHRGELLRIAPELAQRMPTLPKPQAAEPETERYLMFEAVTGLIAAASQASPVVLILDDLQWARTPELLLLKHIVRSGLPMRLLVIATYRDTELSRTHPLTALLADLRRETGIERIAVRGLDEAGVIALVTAAAGHDLDAAQMEVARAIGRETEGSPLFIGEILRNLTESGAVYRDGERLAFRGDIVSLGIPEGVKDAIGRRLSRLSESTNRVLSLASVIGGEFDLDLLTRLAEMAEDAVLDAIDEAKAAMLVAEVAGEPERYAFTHMLMRSTLYEEINPARRARMHRRVGLALEELTAARPGRRIDELTRHWMAATNVGDAAKAVGYARQAGDRALAELAFEEAAKYYEQALAALEHHETDADPLRCDLLIALGDAQRRAGDPAYRGTVTRAVTLARGLGDAKRFALAVLENARPGGFFANANVVDQTLIGLYEEALDKLAGADEAVLRAKLLAQLSIELLYTPQRERRHELSRQAVAVARQCGDKAVLAQALYAHAVAINVPTTLAERLALTAELGDLADEIGSLETGWHADYQRFGALIESGDIAGAEQTLSQLEDVATKLRQAYFSWAPSVARAMISVMRGSPDAEQRVDAAYETGKQGGQPDARTVYLSQLFVIRRDQGRYGELVGPLREVVESQPHVPAWRAALAGLYCETDQLAEARSQMDTLFAGGGGISLDWTWASTVASLAQVCGDLCDRKAAAEVYPHLEAVAGQVGVTGISLVCYGSLALPSGLLAACLERWDEAEHQFKQAMAVNDRIGARPYLVRTRRAYAQMLLDRNRPGDRARASGLIAAAVAEAEALEMEREIIRLDRLCRRVDELAASR